MRRKLMLIGAAVMATAQAAVPHSAFAQEQPDPIATLRGLAREAYAAGDIEAARRAYSADLALQPGHHQLMVEIAALHAEQDAFTEAALMLEAVADLGASFPAEALHRRFGAASSEPQIAAAMTRIEANATPVGTAGTLAVIEDPNLLIEGVAVSPDGRLFVSAIAGRRILEMIEDGAPIIFADAEDGLQAAAGLVMDAERGLLWVATGAAAQAPMPEGEEPAPALIAFDLETGEVAARLEPPLGAGRLADLCLATDGALYVADTNAPRIYRTPGPEGPLELFAELTRARSLQGCAVMGETLYVADYGYGLLRVSRADGAYAVMRQPTDVSLIGVDGLVAHEGALIAVQNGFSPYRVVRVTLSDDGAAVSGVEVLAASLPAFFDPTLGQVVEDRFVFIANSQWPLFPEEGEPDGARGPTHVMAIDLSE